MESIKLTELLYKIKKQNVICSTAEIGSMLPLAKAKCSAKRAVVSTNGPKMSRVCKSLDYILMKKYRGFHSSTAVYIEYPENGDAIYFDGSTAYIESKFSFESLLTAVLLFLTEVSTDPNFSEISAAMQECINEFQTKTEVPEISLGFLCDSVYYSTKDTLQEIKYSPLSPTLTRMIQQGVRTGQFIPFNENIRSFITPDTSKIDFQEKGKEIKQPTSTTKSEDVLEDAINGKYEIQYEWNADSRDRIIPRDMLNEYVSNSAFRSVLPLIKGELKCVTDRLLEGASGKKAIGKNYLNIIFVGKPGTGKTTTAEALSAATGMPIYTVRCSKNIEEGEFEGITKISKGEFILKDTQFLLGFQNGGIVVLEEFNLADPAVMQGALGQAIESPFMLMKDGTDIVTRHPMTIVIATMNVATQGSREPNEAFTSRLPFVFPIEDPTDDEFVNILANASGQPKTDCKKVYKMYKKILSYIEATASGEEFSMCITLRHCLAALRLMKIASFTDAIYNTMVGAVLIRDRALAEDIYKNVVLAVKS